MPLIRWISIFLIITLCPLGGIVYSLNLYKDGLGQFLPVEDLILDIDAVSKKTVELRRESIHLVHTADGVLISLEDQQKQFAQQQQVIDELIKQSLAQKGLSHELYEKQLLAKLGTPIDSFASEKVEILLFELREGLYRGYIAKVKLFDPDAVKVILAQDEFGKAETTSAAVKRKGAVFGVNGGGFYNVSQGGRNIYLPVGNTVIDGKLVGGFTPSRDDLFFCGFARDGSLIGGTFEKQEDLFELSPKSGASFVPILLQDRMPLPIPEKWENARHPRTIIGNFPNGDLFFMVIDGRQPGWSRGATLEEVQIKLLKLGALSAYNLDGGGSSTMVFKGRVLNRPSDGRERPVVTNILIFGE